MRVLIATSTFPIREGDGQARFVLDLASALSGHIDVIVLAPHALGAALSEKIGRVRVRRFRYFFPASLERLSYGAGMRHNIDQSWLARVQIPFLLAAQVVAMTLTARESRVTVINAHWLIPQGLTAALVSRFLGIPMVLHVHAADVYFLRRRPLGGAIARFVVRSSAAVLADGSHVRDSLDALIGFPSHATLRPMGVHRYASPEFESKTPDVELPEEFVAFVGRLVEKKGLEYLIRAMAEVRLGQPTIELVVVGTGPLESDLRGLARELGLDRVTHFLGARPHAQAMAVMKRALVVCVPSIIDSSGETEGMPTVVLEGMAAGVPVVGSEVDGIPDVLKHAENGWLVPPANSAALAVGLLRALSDSSRAGVISAGMATAGQHEWERVAEEYSALLATVAHV